MNGRIILKKADFSANNIGRYSLTSSLTARVLAKQTQYSKDSAEATILDNFLGTLTQKGYLGGENPLLSLLFLPCLANDHNQLMYNVAQLDNDGYPINEMAQLELDATEEQQVYKPVYDGSRIIGMKACYPSDATNEAERRPFKSYVLNRGENEKLNSFSYVSYHLNPAPGWTHVFFSTGTPMGTTVRFNCNTGTAGYLAALYADTDIMRASLTGDLRGFVGISYKSGDRFYGVVDNGVIGESTYNSNTTDRNPNDYVIINGAISDKTHMSNAVFALGECLTTEQLTELRSIIMEFLGALNIE